MNLVIVESPAKCGKIQGFLGPEYKVIATMGHIRALDEDLDAIGIDRDFDLRYVFIKEKARAIQGIKAAAASAKKVILASDDDREGEAISFAVCVLLSLDPRKTQRAVFHEITKSAVTAAIATPRVLDMNRVNAQQARAALDMMIGFTISPLLWKYVARGMSAGRCQTPALRIIVDRENEISRHVTTSSWTITGKWSAPGLFVPFKFDATFGNSLPTEESVRTYMSALIAQPRHTIMKTALAEWKESPPLPFITSTLQQAASASLKSSPKKTMSAAQKLYEAGHITYMRTDSAVLSEEAVAAASDVVREKWGEEYIGPQNSTATKAKTANAQEAHEAIRPTHFDVSELGDDWTITEKRIYKMIWLRAIQSVMAAVQGEQRTIEFAEGWRASWRRTTFAGWRKAGEAAAEGNESSEAEDSAATAWEAALRLEKGATVTWDSIQAKPHDTTPPRRYTEATLISALEKSGIGRPSTFASLVETIREKNYVTIADIEGKEVDVPVLNLTGPAGPVKVMQKRVVGGEKSKLVATELGRQVLAFCLQNFADLFDYTFTAQMEERLDLVARGEEAWKTVLSDTWGAYKEKYRALRDGAGTVAAQVRENRRNFSDGLVAIIRKTGEPLLLREGGTPTFYGWPKDLPFADITEELALQFIATRSVGQAVPTEGGDVLGHWNGEAVLKKRGKYGFYVACGGASVACSSDITLEGAIQKLEEKAGMKTRMVGGYELRQTEKGAYMFKKALKTKKFVTIPAGLDILKLSAGEVEAIYKTGTGGAAAPRKKIDKK